MYKATLGTWYVTLENSGFSCTWDNLMSALPPFNKALGKVWDSSYLWEETVRSVERKESERLWNFKNCVFGGRLWVLPLHQKHEKNPGPILRQGKPGAPKPAKISSLSSGLNRCNPLTESKLVPYSKRRKEYAPASGERWVTVATCLRVVSNPCQVKICGTSLSNH